jgi:RNA-binding protein YhbY
MIRRVPEIQIGKNGLVEGTFGILRNMFKNHENVRVSILKSGTRDKEEAEKIAKQIIEKLGRNYTYRIIGFVIALKKLRKPQK